MDTIKKSISLCKLTTLILLCSTTAANANFNLSGFRSNANDLWSGPYIGLNIGGGSANGTQTLSSTSTGISSSNTSNIDSSFSFVSNQTSATSGQLKDSASGYNGNVFIGWNYHLDQSNFIIGGQLEGSIFNSSVLQPSGQVSGTSSAVSTQVSNGTTTITTTSGTATTNTISSVNLYSILTFAARAGFLVKPKTLIYGLGGPASGNMSDPIDAKWVNGYTAGGGVEHKFTKNWSVNAGYRYLHFNLNTNFSFNQTNSSASVGPSSTSNTQSIGQETIRTNFAYNLGSIGVAYRWA